ncbi:MAG: hypothetical protein LPK19_04515, partial [Hymenobacteraceae bacterium]|nr:hypothetical protein [Hymenobacteraceae bacterium]MDX5395459.1 hypothetical protein [Hymenobacteraceae bacterium]MDX5511508.1 hypothetical protein [Hymenobacteraceae bacterium]
NILAKRSKNAVAFYANQQNPALFDREISLNMLILQQLITTSYALGKQQQAAELEQFFMQYYNLLM